MKDVIRQLAEAMSAASPDAQFEVRYWDGTGFSIGTEPEFILHFKNERALSRVLSDAFMGFGESYMLGDIEVEGDIKKLFYLGFAIDFAERPMSLMLRLKLAFHFLRARNTIARSRENISFSYDIGNDFYEILLGKGMIYTCAYFTSPDNTLDEAQNNKLELVCRKLCLKPGEHIADLGCGWGGFLMYAAENYGITGVGFTISAEQRDYAVRKIAERGLSDKIEIRLKDAREADGLYDKVASIGMVEHMGNAQIAPVFERIAHILKPQGLAFVHTIGNEIPRPIDPWIDKYIFPGTQASPLTTMVEAAGKNDLYMIDLENIRLHYPPTVKYWLANFDANIDRIREMYDDTFVRSFRLYLEVASSSFSWGDNRLYHLLMTKGLNNDVPMTREHLVLPKSGTSTAGAAPEGGA
ncbi:probable cyclopropane-fatty-acyl-phospholipid synthase [Stappia aggregata IAM 12614]|uniref:Probable cyclopropane-fatty-acyl-phospholipid synthase n=1 Tax=Roseibium aggregatum (strain ATCC 25650 / DSM 13394 / JCM 20685 / NBRC 16684 / NCIMB 2208 / IAM 12614 / B1) TaxID=384765 RepID=A0NZP8_ROSAI|nr:cyclopropane-fatty-acyl-phospholipid synthase family protein [Roseibium aggregatum]EAV41615.1 probable cyclopropane-fatty-acyl-phospholipid synthase [Stappia aggregata IAM 12614] [Roseibium aggregatum IAM 12614]